jgi:hypothetical protein
MKTLSLLFISLFFAKGCDPEKKQDIDTAIIEYVANTRGFYQKITIENKLVTVSNDRNATTKKDSTKISDTDWKVLVEQFEELNLEDLKDLKIPTEKRFYDGAAIANLKIIYKGVTYETPSFDHGSPPYEIKKLVNKINSFAKQNDDN